MNNLSPEKARFVFTPPLGQVSDSPGETCTFGDQEISNARCVEEDTQRTENEVHYLTGTALPAFTEGRNTTTRMHFSRPKRLSSSPIGPDEARHCGTVSVVQYTEANWPRPATSGGLRRPEAHVSEDGQSLSCAGAVVREAPEAQGDGAAVTRICPRWRGRAAAVVAAAAS